LAAVSMPRYPIRTSRLLIRPWRESELATYHELRSDPRVARYLYDPPLTREQAATRLRSLVTTIESEGVWLNLALELAGDGAVVGDVGLCWLSDAHRQAEVGYTLLPAHHGHGYATEAAAAMVGVAFDSLGAHRVRGRLDARNEPSARVLERLGMRREAHLVENEFVKGEWADELVYAVLAHEWRRARGGPTPGSPEAPFADAG
jgi:RimJ/RimL family protein N-acetyltransferase